MEMVTQCYKIANQGEMSYVRIETPKGQEQELPYGATKLTVQAYEQEMQRVRAEFAEKLRETPDPEPQPAPEPEPEPDPEAVEAATAELAALGLSEKSIATLLGVNRA